MKVHVFETAEETIQAVADFFIQTLSAALEKSQRASVALSGGNSPKRLFELLASPVYRSKVDWEKIYFFFVDERYVPFDDPANNGRMTKESLFDPLGIKDSKIFYFDTSIPPKDAAEQYEEQIAQFFIQNPGSFDLILLGLGDDAHTASLFPGTPILDERDRNVMEVYVPQQQAFRLTLTAPFINKANAVAFLVYGASKQQALQVVLQNKGDYHQFPALLINPASGNLHWFFDSTAK